MVFGQQYETLPNLCKEWNIPTSSTLPLASQLAQPKIKLVFIPDSSLSSSPTLSYSSSNPLPPVNLPQALIIIGIPQRKPVTTWNLEISSPFWWESPKWQNPPQVFFFFFYGCTMQHLSFPTRESMPPAEEAHNFNHWTTREVPFYFSLKLIEFSQPSTWEINSLVWQLLCLGSPALWNFLEAYHAAVWSSVGRKWERAEFCR